MQPTPPTFHATPTTLGPATTAPLFQPALAPEQHPAGPRQTTDSWITDPNWNVTQNHPTSWLASKLPRINLAPYDGDPRNWSYFIQNLKCLVHDVVPDNGQRIIFLKDYLSENVCNSIANSLRDPAQHRSALAKLQRRYGNPKLVVRAHVQSLLQLVGPKEGDFEALCVFFGAIQAAVADLTNGGHLHDLLAPGLLYQVTSKLPPALMQKWGEEMCSLQPRTATLIDFDQWLESRVMAGTWAAPALPPFSNAGRPRERAQKGKEEPKRPTVRHPRILHTSQRAPCAACSGPHTLENCNKFSKPTPKARAELLLEKGCCFRCLHPGHSSKACKKGEDCGQDNCKSYHHPMLHGAPWMFAPPKSSQTDTPQTKPAAPTALSLFKKGKNFCITNKKTSPDQVLLAVVHLRIEANGRSFATYGLLDPGAEMTLVTKDVLRMLKLNPPREKMQIGILHGDGPLLSVQRADLHISSLDNSFSFTAYEVPALTTFNLHPGYVDWPNEKKKYPHLADLDLPPVDFSKITIFLGFDYQEAIEPFQIRKSTSESPGPWVIKTVFEWCALVPLYKAAGQHSPPSINLIQNRKKSNLNEMVHQLWSIESFGTHPDVKAPISGDDARALKLLEENVRHFGDRYEAPLLWKLDQPNLPDNHAVALSRFYTMDRSLKKCPVKSKAYEATINDYITQGCAKKNWKKANWMARLASRGTSHIMQFSTRASFL